MKQNRLLEDPVRSVFLSYLVPSVSATLVTSIYILADTMMIGRGIGSVGIAALNILLPLYSTFFGFGMMCGIGGSVLFGFFYNCRTFSIGFIQALFLDFCKQTL